LRLKAILGGIPTLLLEGRDDNEGNNGGGELTPPLRSEDSGHHATTNAGRGVFGSDGGGKRVVTANADTHDEAPHDEDTNDADCWAVTGNGLTKGCD